MLKMPISGSGVKSKKSSCVNISCNIGMFLALVEEEANTLFSKKVMMIDESSISSPARECR
jgi:hypothetical protein